MNLPPIVRPEILAYAAMMERVMATHDAKLGDSWKQASRNELVAALANASNSLQEAKRRNDTIKLIEQCLDVANLAMMLGWHHHHFGTIAYDGLTERQSQVLDFIRVFVAENGFSPTYREIKAGVGVGNLTTIQDAIECLCRRGAITIAHKTPRSIKIMDPTRTPGARKTPRNRQK